MAWIRGSLLGGTPPTPVVKKFRFLKWHITGTRDTSSYIQMSEIKFLAYNDTAYTFSSNLVSRVVNGATTPDEPVKNLTDGNVGTKCCISWNNNYIDIIFDLQSGYELDLNTYKIFQWYTANDSLERDPSTWVLYGANLSDFSDAVILNQARGYTAPIPRQALGYEGWLTISGGGESAEITFDFTPYKWNSTAEIKMAEDIGGSNVGDADDASQSIMSFIATGNITVNINPFAAYTNTSSDDGYIAMVVDGVTRFEKQLLSDAWVNLSDIPPIVLRNGETLEIRCGFHNHHSGCYFQLKQI